MSQQQLQKIIDMFLCDQVALGAPHKQARLTGLSGLTTHLGVIEAYRPGAPVPVAFPIGRARVVQRVSGALAGSARR